MRLSDFGKVAEAPAESPVQTLPEPEPRPKAGPSPKETYGRAIEAARRLVGGAADKADTRALAAQAARDLTLGVEASPFAMLELAHRSTAGNYLYGHAVNTAIYAVRVAGGMDWDFEKRCGAAEAALWHDAALAMHVGLGRLGRAVPTDSFSESVLHPLESGQHVRSLPEAAAAFQEKLPWLMGRDSWSGAQASSQLVSFCALYESMTHWRPWRAPFVPSDAVKMMTTGHAHAPCNGLARPFLAQMSLYPVGSWVRLSNRDVGVVTKAQPGVVLNPEVAVYMGQDGILKPEPVVIDLKKTPLTRVLEPVDPFEALRPHTAFLTRLRLSRWWIPA